MSTLTSLLWLAACGSPVPTGGVYFANDGASLDADGAAGALPVRDGGVEPPDGATPDALPGWLLDAGVRAPDDDDSGSAVSDGTHLDGVSEDAPSEDAEPQGADALDTNAGTDSGGEADADSAPDVGPPPDCSDGPCCDPAAGLFLAAGTACGAAKPDQWQCSGQKLQARSVQGSCTGAEAACAGPDLLGGWQTKQTCSAAETCGANPPKCSAAAVQQLDPCGKGKCWQSKIPLPASCGSSVKTENFGSGNYNVHRYILNTQAKITIDLSLATTAGAWQPALVIQDAKGDTVFDGQYGTSTSAIEIQAKSPAKTAGPAKVQIKTSSAVQLFVFVTGWAALESNFSQFLSKSVKYALTISLDCAPPSTGTLTSPPCFDPKNVKGGYYLLPQSCPPGLYTRKPDDCSRGTKRLIDVIYTVAVRSKKEQPTYAPLHFNDLNEGSCSVVDHLTHDDGTHADVHSGCATNVSCADNGPAIALAKMFIDTGEACGILFNDTGVQQVVNAYFTAKHNYKPWGSKFMRSVTGHNTHFHVRVKKPDGSCN